MKRYDIYCALFWTVMAIFVIGVSLKLGLGTLGYPAPGFFPLIVGFLLLGLSLLLIIMAGHEGKKNPNFKEVPVFPRNVWINCAVMLAYSFFLEFLGYIISSSVLMLYLFKYPGSRQWRSSILITIIVVSLTFYFFGVLLEAQFPKGIFKIG